MLYQAMVFLVFSNSMQRGVNIENTDKSTIPLDATNGILIWSTCFSQRNMPSKKCQPMQVRIEYPIRARSHRDFPLESKENYGTAF